jgi:putative FmdB family regulatory protein
MPFYEYQCEKCGEIYEFFIRNGSDVPEKCEVCGGRLHKIISLSTFQLKGSGWYMTDYARKNSPAENKNKGNGSNGNNGSGDSSDRQKETKDIKTASKSGSASHSSESTAK